MYLAAIADAQPPPPTTGPAPAPAMATQVVFHDAEIHMGSIISLIYIYIYWISLLLCVFLLDDGTTSFDATA